MTNNMLYCFCCGSLIFCFSLFVLKSYMFNCFSWNSFLQMTNNMLYCFCCDSLIFRFSLFILMNYIISIQSSYIFCFSLFVLKSYMFNCFSWSSFLQMTNDMLYCFCCDSLIFRFSPFILMNYMFSIQSSYIFLFQSFCFEELHV